MIAKEKQGIDPNLPVVVFLLISRTHFGSDGWVRLEQHPPAKSKREPPSCDRAPRLLPGNRGAYFLLFTAKQPQRQHASCVYEAAEEACGRC